MEFPFNVNAILPNQITKIRSNLLPEGFVGDRRDSQNCIDKISDILDGMGEASAKAQGLQRAVTSGEKMRNVDYTVYIFVEPEENNGKGTVIGLLKVGRKNLFVFDASGAHKEVQPLCILDFYIHESKQRMGMGKILYDYMLQEESVLPIHLAIDRPSEKFMNFLLKHYGLKNILPQNNNFVVYDGFFENNPDMIQMGWKGHHYPEYPNNKSVAGMNSTRVIEAAGSTNSSPHFGRHAAYKRETTMGQIIQNVFPCGELKRVASDGIDPANLHDGEKDCLSGSDPDLQTGSPRHEQHEKRHEKRHYEQDNEQHDEQQHEKQHYEQHDEQQHEKRHEKRHYEQDNEQHDEQQHEKQHYEQHNEQHDEQQHEKRHYEQDDEQHDEQQHEKRHYEQHYEQHNEQQHDKRHYEQHDEQQHDKGHNGDHDEQQDKRHYEQHNEQLHSRLW